MPQSQQSSRRRTIFAVTLGGILIVLAAGLGAYLARRSASVPETLPPEPGTSAYEEATQSAKDSIFAKEEAEMRVTAEAEEHAAAVESGGEDVQPPAGFFKDEVITLESQQLVWNNAPKNVSFSEDTETHVIGLAKVTDGPWRGASVLLLVEGGMGGGTYIALQQDAMVAIAPVEKDAAQQETERAYTYNVGTRVAGSGQPITVYKAIDIVQLRYEPVVRGMYHGHSMTLLLPQISFRDAVFYPMLTAAQPDGIAFDDGAKRYLKKIDYVHPLYGQAWITNRAKIMQKDSDTTEKYYLFRLGGVYFRSAANTPIMYALIPDVVSESYTQKLVSGDANSAFSSDGDVLAIAWKDGTRNTQRYMYRAGGCGMETFVTGSDSPLYTTINQEDLVAVGHSDSGRTIYTFRSAQHPLVREAFAAYEATKNDMWTREQMQKTLGKRSLANAQELLDRKMIIAFKDVFDRWHVLKSTVLAPPVECGKPVIYLYPQEPTDVRVQVRPDGGFTVTDPVYPSGGWRVHAQPNGQLTDLHTGTTYPYLYWEGNSSVPYARPHRGWVVARDELDAFFERTLAAQGLNAQERADFRDFWVARMRRNPSPYFFVTYASRAFIDRAAPLAITPRPDTVIRVLMDYVPLLSRDAMGAVAPLPLVAQPRTGFTVVEWGGRLKN